MTSLIHTSVEHPFKTGFNQSVFQRTTAEAEFGYQNEIILLGMVLPSTCSAKL